MKNCRHDIFHHFFNAVKKTCIYLESPAEKRFAANFRFELDVNIGFYATKMTYIHQTRHLPLIKEKDSNDIHKV